jgi:NadR type nicotinamide-nucleotide adenylyltransferase
MEKRTTGLVLGKFAPFHKGHQFLVEFAKVKVDKLYVLIYEARETTHIPLETRAGWIRHIYPDVTVIDGHDAPTVEGTSEQVKKIQEDYIVKMMPEPITHFFSSEWYGEHVSKALGATNVLVDADRKNVPVSATKVRNGEVSGADFLHPIVNRDIVRKVVILGAESTGKTTLTRELAKEYKTNWVPEYGRDYWDANHDERGNLTAEQLVELAKTHRMNEEKTFQLSNRIVFIDTGATTTRQYCRDYGYTVPMELDTMVHDERSRYDLFILCKTDIPYEDDGTRRGEKVRKETQEKIIADLTHRGIPFWCVSGTLGDRIRHMKYGITKELGIY